MTPKVIPFREDDPRFWLEQGQRAMASRDLAEAEIYLERALHAAPSDLAVLNTRARLHLQLREPALALRLLERASRQDPSLPEIWNNLGVAQTRLSNFKGAEASFAAALELAPGDPEVLNNRALARLQSGQVWQALDDLTEVVSQTPDRSTSWQHKGVAHMQLRQLREARHAFLFAGKRLWAEGGAKRQALLLITVAGLLGFVIRSGLGDHGPRAAP